MALKVNVLATKKILFVLRFHIENWLTFSPLINKIRLHGNYSRECRMLPSG